MNEPEKSDNSVVSEKPANKVGLKCSAAELVEKRELAKGNPNQQTSHRTQSKRMRAKLQELKEELRQRMNHPVPETGAWLRRVVQGYYNYHSVPRNGAAMRGLTRALLRHWWKSLRRRSHKSNCDWKRFYHRTARRWMLPLRVMHPYPEHRLHVTT